MARAMKGLSMRLDSIDAEFSGLLAPATREPANQSTWTLSQPLR
jgi:hypothetical protein